MPSIAATVTNGHLRQPLKQLLPAAAHRDDFALRRTERRQELANVGPGDERARLARLNHQPRQVAASFQLVEQGRQLLEHRQREDVRPFARQVERDQGHVRLRKRERQRIGMARGSLISERQLLNATGQGEFGKEDRCQARPRGLPGGPPIRHNADRFGETQCEPGANTNDVA